MPCIPSAVELGNRGRGAARRCFRLGRAQAVSLGSLGDKSNTPVNQTKEQDAQEATGDPHGRAVPSVSKTFSIDSEAVYVFMICRAPPRKERGSFLCVSAFQQFCSLQASTWADNDDRCVFIAISDFPDGFLHFANCPIALCHFSRSSYSAVMDQYRCVITYASQFACQRLQL